MECLQLKIPPMPQFLTSGHAVWKTGMQHFPRAFQVYDLVLVCSGAVYITEEETEYEVGPGMILLLEPGKKHVGHRPCLEPTELYWVHFTHGEAVNRMTTKQVVWSSQVRQGTDEDLQPEEQFLYLPKFGRFHNQALLPLLQEMLSLRSGLTMERAFDLQLLLGKLLSSLQSELRTPKRVSRSIQIAEQVKQYLIKQFDQPYQAEHMAEVLHFDGDYAARCLKKHTGMSPIQYHAYVRMEEARKLLIQTDLPVQEVAKRVGYADYNYFIRMFRKTVGVPPREYRYGKGDTN